MRSLENDSTPFIERWGGQHRSLLDPINKYYPLIGLMVIMLALGLVLRQQIPLSDAPLLEYRLFFELMIAGTVISLLRSKFGLITYGTFGPVIISYVLLSTGLFWGTVLFTNIFIVALATYIVLEPFKLGTAHRIGSLIVTVGAAITIFHVLAESAVITPNLGDLGVYFPAIIIGWYADRFARDLSERGWRAPAIRFSWTLVGIVAAYLVLSVEPLMVWFIHTPEAWAGALLANVYFGSRGNLRFKEYLRFSNVFPSGKLRAMETTARTRAHNAKAHLINALGGDAQPKAVNDVLSMNERNRYIRKYNPGYLSPLLDKASMKKTFHSVGVPTPETYLLVESQEHFRAAAELIESRDEFVIKPSDSYGGEGIIVVTGRVDGGNNENSGLYETSKGVMNADELMAHIRSITEGQYAPMDLEGTALIEQLIHPSGRIQEIAGQGVPDIRVIVFRGVPIMAMTRLPTEDSGGAANLHMGAVGVGLTVADGNATGGYQSTNRWIDHHPDTNADLHEFSVPGWDEILSVALKAAGSSHLGYTGVDIVIDDRMGPVVLEINRRPGLGIQNSTFDGILKRLRAVEALPDKFDLRPPADKLRLAQQWDRQGWEPRDGHDRLETTYPDITTSRNIATPPRQPTPHSHASTNTSDSEHESGSDDHDAGSGDERVSR